jgi:hypothetical protein
MGTEEELDEAADICEHVRAGHPGSGSAKKRGVWILSLDARWV